MLQKGALLENHFFYEIRSKTKLQCIFSAVSIVLFLVEFKKGYSDTIATLQESMFYKKRFGIIDHSCYASQVSQKIIFHHSTRNDIREKLSIFNLVINLNI